MTGWTESSGTLAVSFQPTKVRVTAHGQAHLDHNIARPNDDPVTLSVAVNKPLVCRLLAKRGLRTPNHFEFTLSGIAQAVAFMKRFGAEWVIKPANGASGHGVTAGIITRFDLVWAAVAAAACESNLVVEQQVEGDVYRLLYLHGKLLDAVLRKSPTVVADGGSSVRNPKALFEERQSLANWPVF